MNFNDTYSRDSYRSLIKGILPDYSDDVRKVSVDTPSANIKEACLLGESKDFELSVFELQHSGSADKRISLAHAGFRLMKSVACYRALIAYYSPDTESWRLSLMTLNPAVNEKGKVSLEASNPRRYSYFLGPDAKVHTPHDRLVRSGAIKDFDDLLARFSVEVVTNEFFKRYKELFEKLVKHLEKDHAFTAFAGRSNVVIEDFAKKLLGQIVFIYFLQRKRWVGAKKGKSIHEGDKDFLRTLFQKAVAEQKNFFNEYLEPLFYDGLNNSPKRAGSFYREYFDCQIPFLNGGLFEPLNNYDWRNAFLFIPDELFSNSKETGILDVFDLYNFTVAEDDPIDVEVSVDPEMLGKVFENLLAENLRKGKGTYYTPRAIVHYMCRESLINYLASESKIDEEKIRQLVEQKNLIADADLAKLDSVEEHETAAEKILIFDKVEAKKLNALLEDIKVCDPACGSGAFLVGMLHEIVNARQFLDTWYLGDRFTNYNLKKYAIQNSVYGVDIDPGAVDIAKLRMWLSMVVDYDLDDIEPLPNLDYKIMQGNSLLEELVVGDTTLKLYDPKLNNGNGKRKRKNLFEEDDQQDLFGQTSGQHRLIDELNRLHREYFELSDLKAKRRKREKIKAIEHELVERTVKQELKKLEGQSKNIGKYLSPVKGMSKKDAEEYAVNLSKQTQLSRILKEFDASTNRPYFLWHLNFADVFEQKSGFDVVIANPPYLSALEFASLHSPEERKALNTAFGSAKGTYDIYILFIEKAISLLRHAGKLAFINPNKYLAAKYAQALRKYILENATLDSLVDVSGIRVFEEASVYPVLSFMSRGSIEHDYNVRLWLPKIRHSKTFDISEYVNSSLRSNTLSLLPENIWGFLLSSKAELLSSLLEESSFLSDFGDINASTTAAEADSFGAYISNKQSPDSLKVVNTGLIDSYISTWGEKELTNKRKKYKTPFLSLRYVNKRRKAMYEAPKVVYAKMAKQCEAFLDLSGEYAALNTNFFYNPKKELSLKFVAAYSNSKMFMFFYSQLFGALRMGGGFYQFQAPQLRVMPCKIPDQNTLELIEDKVDKILNSTSKSSYSNNLREQNIVEEYTSDIDQLIYKLYGLTAAEIKIIESNG